MRRDLDSGNSTDGSADLDVPWRDKRTLPSIRHHVNRSAPCQTSASLAWGGAAWVVAHNDMCGRHAPTRGKTTIDDGLNRPYTWGRRLGFGARRSGAARRELALGIEQLSSVGKVAAFLDLQEHDVTKLLEEERLAGTLIVSLKARGESVTPNVKTSVESLVRGMAPKRDEQDSKAHLLNSGATTTIMFTDVVGSTTITDRLGDREARMRGCTTR